MIAKGHDLLERGTLSDLKYVNNVIDEIVKRLSNNKESIDMFHLFYLKLLDRVFGKETTTGSTTVDDLAGGWMRELANERQPGLTEAAVNLLLHLSPRSELFSVLSKIQMGGYEIKISMLSQKSRFFLLNNPVYECLHSERHRTLYQFLLRTPISKQTQVYVQLFLFRSSSNIN
jgi:hypothetical protein